MEMNVKQIFTDQQKQELIEQWKQSGKTKIDFCKERDLKYFSFVGWSSDKKKKKRSVDNSSFVPVKISRNTEALFAQLTLKNGAILNIYHPVEAGYLSALVK